MMYNNLFAAAIMVDNKVLNESKGVYYLPFGTEYSIYLKNLNSIRASVNMTIDGESITQNKRILIEPNSACILERYIDKPICFKFIEKTNSIREYRGNRIDDGIIRIGFQFAVKQEVPYVIPYPYQWPSDASVTWTANNSNADVDRYMHTPPKYIYQTWCKSGAHDGGVVPQSMTNKSVALDECCDGITVGGSDSTQRITTVTCRDVFGDENIIVLQLKGFSDNNDRINTIEFSKNKRRCETCGKVNKIQAKFCQECGSRLA